MASSKRVIMMVVFVVIGIIIMLIEGSSAVNVCNMSEDDLMTCKPSVTKGAVPVNPPPRECCKALSGADLTCLCSYRDSFLLPSLGIDPALAMALPAKCNLTPPPNC